jgi:hypothetical protein
VFQLFGLVVDFVPAVSQVHDQVRLNEPVPPDHGEGKPDALRRQRDGAVRLVEDQALVLELAHHFGDRGIGYAEALCKLGGGDGLVLPFREGIDDLNVVLD